MCIEKRFKEMMLSQMGHLQTEPEIIELAESLRELPLFYELSNEEYEKVIDVSLETLQISFGESYSVESDEKLRPWFQEHYKELGVTRWDRYKDYLQNVKKFSPNTLNSMALNLFKITDLLGDPVGTNFKRKGLVVGDVQSGKTANYIGLMNLAIDAGYKLMIVLTGTTNTLREQTQIRIEDGLGKKSKNPKGITSIQNSEYKDIREPVYITTVESDFTKSAAKALTLSLEQTNVPIVIVTKKNSSALKNIYEWLEEYSKLKNHDHINSSLLLIDDEADFASVNTKKYEDTPTAINSKIRSILELFTKSSYIGFTATPYANIFIDPETNDEMYGQDLFPRDYIYVLGESSEYVGVQQLFSEDTNLEKALYRLYESEVECYLPLKHKKDYSFTNLPPTLVHAINTFFISNVIRDIRGDKTKHRSMMINMSRFSSMHETFKEVILEKVNAMQKEIRLYSKLPYEEALNNKVIKSIKKSYDEEYSGLEDGITFEEILKNLNDSVYRIKVGIVNMHHKEVDYQAYQNEGERIIVIGGFALSRGLTLEGLTVSYYWRNSVMYDSLLQMGRWFGYRPNYKDLVRVFMAEDVISDFKFIAMATAELKEDLRVNSDKGLTPRDFGIKIRSGQTGLIITSRNKMRTGVDKITSVDFNYDIVETVALSVNNHDINDHNKKIIAKFIEQFKMNITQDLTPDGKRVIKGLKNIDKVHIIEFLKNYIPVLGSKFDTQLIQKWLVENNSDVLSKWDVAFMTGSFDNMVFDYGNDFIGNGLVRSVKKINNSNGIYQNMRSRLGSPRDGRIGLTIEQLEIIKNANISNKTIPQKNYFSSVIRRKPLMYIYSVMPIDSVTKEGLTDYLIPLITLGIPDLGRGKSKVVQYKVNKIYQLSEEFEEEVEE